MMAEKRYIFKLAETAEDMAAVFQIRRKVFAEEQRLFQNDDRDKNDEAAVHILALLGPTGEAVGTVRCYPVKSGIWAGGRLAVLRAYRGRLGAQLVKQAVHTMLERDDCKEFYAQVQEQNVHFFQRLGWKLMGKASVFHGVRHELMQSDLKDRL